MTPFAIALNRLGLGARPNVAPRADPQRRLLEQLDACELLPRTVSLVDVWNNMQRSLRQAPEGQRSGIREAHLREGNRSTSRAWAHA